MKSYDVKNIKTNLLQILKIFTKRLCWQTGFCIFNYNINNNVIIIKQSPVCLYKRNDLL